MVCSLFDFGLLNSGPLALSGYAAGKPSHPGKLSETVFGQFAERD